MKIKEVIPVAARSGFFNRDLAAVKAGARADGFAYPGAPVSPGFKKIVQPGTAISVMLLLDDGQVAFGDCVDVILAGVAGRDPLFQAEHHLEFLRTTMRDLLRGRPVDRFRALAEEVDGFVDGGRCLHTALRYGITQAILHAAALVNHCTMAEIVSREYGCAIVAAPIPILASCHKEDAQMIDRMILKQVELLPHASFQQVERDIGLQGEKLIAYAEAIVSRIREIGAPDYLPRIHLDVYGTLGELFGADVDALAGYLGRLEAAVEPHELLLESFVIAASRAAQIDAFRALRSAIAQRGLGVKIVVDEWCNTLDDIKAFADAEAADYAQIKTPDLGGVTNSIEAVLYARGRGMGCCLGGTGNETDQSARITAQIGLACRPDFLLSKPGFGGDEALMIQTNEMLRTLALIDEHARTRARSGGSSGESEMTISLRDVTAETVRAICALETTQEQRRFVSPNAVSIAEAYFEPAASFRAIYAGETPVGFLMWRMSDADSCHLWRFMIEARHQRRGYGRSALALFVDDLREQGVKRLTLSCAPGTDGPQGFYLALGFVDTGKVVHGGNRVLSLSLLQPKLR